MLDKEEDSRTKNDIDDIAAFLGETEFAKNSGYELNDVDKLLLFKSA